MTEIRTTRASAAQPSLRSRSGDLARLYEPGWIDHLIDWVDLLPGPWWLFYLGLGIVLTLTLTSIQWLEGSYPIGTFEGLHVFLVAQVAYGLGLMHYLDRMALKALEEFKSALTAGEAEYARLQYELISLPARPTAFASLLGTLFALTLTALLLPSFLPMIRAAPTSLSVGSLVFFTALIWWVFGALIYHTLHQLRVVDAIYTRHTRIDLFRLDPLYAFSSFTARTAIGLVILNVLWIVVMPEVVTNVIALIPAAIFLLAVGAAFLWPLLGIHRLLVNEQRRLLAEASHRLQAAIQELHSRIDELDFQDFDGLNKAMASLEIEHQALKRIPTWPWQPGTLRGLLGALIVPILIWLMQFLLLNYLDS